MLAGRAPDRPATNSADAPAAGPDIVATTVVMIATEPNARRPDHMADDLALVVTLEDVDAVRLIKDAPRRRCGW
jgi:hypothetical protein